MKNHVRQPRVEDQKGRQAGKIGLVDDERDRKAREWMNKFKGGKTLVWTGKPDEWLLGLQEPEAGRGYWIL